MQSLSSLKQRTTLLTTEQFSYLMFLPLLKRLNPQTTRGAKKVQSVKGLLRMEDLS